MANEKQNLPPPPPPDPPPPPPTRYVKDDSGKAKL